VTQSPDAFVKSFTTKLRELRKANGVTGEQLAERLEVPVQNLRRIEAGQNVTLKTIARIALALGCQVRITFVRLRR
jgi:transcriptional regulator with XRE-family HTH domain